LRDPDEDVIFRNNFFTDFVDRRAHVYACSREKSYVLFFRLRRKIELVLAYSL